MKTIELDLTGCKYLGEIHERIRKEFAFPEWYGANWDAFWDLLRSECDAEYLFISGIKTLSVELSEAIKPMFNVLDDLVSEREKYKDFTTPFGYKILS